MAFSKLERRAKLKGRIRNIISGSSEKPRLSVFRSNKQIYAQIIDDVSGNTLCSVSSKDSEVSGKTNSEIAKSVGEVLASKAISSEIKNVVFDRSGYLYHGRVKALAEGARSGGLQF